MPSTIVVDKIQKTGGEAIQWPDADGAAGTVLRTTGSGVLEFAVDAGIASLAADGSPQLGADLDILTYGITSSNTIMNPTLTSTGKALVLGF